MKLQAWKKQLNDKCVSTSVVSVDVSQIFENVNAINVLRIERETLGAQFKLEIRPRSFHLISRVDQFQLFFKIVNQTAT